MPYVGFKATDDDFQIIKDAMRLDPVKFRSITDVCLEGLKLVKREMKIGDTFAPSTPEIHP